MSSTLPAPAAAAPAVATSGLDGLRAELDRIDDAIHDLLMDRAAVVGQVAAARAKGNVPLRPGREAAILRRLLARHRGALPPAMVAQVWREVVSAGSAMQGRLVIAVCETPGGAPLAVAAREHFGALVALRVHRTPAQAMGDLSAGRALAAILPLPREDDAAPWRPSLLHKRVGAGELRLGVVGRLPFWAPRPESAPETGSLLLSTAPPDPSGDDRTLLGLELPADMSRARLSAALVAAGFAGAHIILRRDTDAALALADVPGFLLPGDPRLPALAGRPPVILGAYAVPFQPALPSRGSDR